MKRCATPAQLLRYRNVAIIGFANFAACCARADMLEVTASRDNTLYEISGGLLSNGAGQHLFAGNSTSTTSRRALLRFDVAGSVPQGSTITSVTLRLNMSRTIAGATNVTLHRMTADWGEGASDAGGEEGGGAASATGDATWEHRFFSTVTWGTAGGDFAANAAASTAVDVLGGYTWGPTLEMTADVQAWLDAPATNFGWIVIGDETMAVTAKRFDSRENPTAANRPRLTIVFTPPPPPITDCNQNGAADAQDIANGTSGDCNADGVPDECQPDGDGDGSIDACDGCTAARMTRSRLHRARWGAA
jgi:hypothetical protein